jgi:hypothetical protein
MSLMGENVFFPMVVLNSAENDFNVPGSLDEHNEKNMNDILQNENTL